MKNSAISWTTHTFNPWRGCLKISPGCANCYAATMSYRNTKVLGVWGPPETGTRVLASGAQWHEPIKWARAARQTGERTRVFCASLADVFEVWDGQMKESTGAKLWCYAFAPDGPFNGGPAHNDGCVPYTLDHARTRLWELIRDTPELDWLVLTKRPENVARMMPPGDWPNVWLGVSVENQTYTWRMDAVLEVMHTHHFPVRFISAEPLIGELDVRRQMGTDGFNWLIVGGESGREARPMHIAWVYYLLGQCRVAGVPIFIKQFGKVAIDPNGNRHQTPHDTTHGGDTRDWPWQLVFRDFPEVSHAVSQSTD